MMKVEPRKIAFFGDVAGMDELPKYNPRQESVDEKIELLDIVALTQDIAEYNLRRGEVGTVVEILSNGDAFEVEFCDRHGRTYECRSFLASQLMVLHYEPMSTPDGASPMTKDTKVGLEKNTNDNRQTPQNDTLSKRGAAPTTQATLP